MRELAVGQRVICKYKNGRYYHSEVLELSPTTFYEVVFDDGSYSDNLFPEDIEVGRSASDLKILEPHMMGNIHFLSFLGSYVSFHLSLQSRDCVRLGPPAKGDAVQVRWTDGLIYGAKFVTSHSIPMYLVKLASYFPLWLCHEKAFSPDPNHIRE